MTSDAAARFEALFRATYPAVRRYAFHRAITGSDADDLVAETYVVAWRRLDAVPEDDPLPWLLAVAANVRRNRARSARRYQALIDRLPLPQPAPPPSVPNEDAAEVVRALATLSDDDQEILRLVAWDGLTPQQAATVLGTTGAAARLRLHRARRRLSERLGRRTEKRQPPIGQFRDDREEVPHGQAYGY